MKSEQSMIVELEQIRADIEHILEYICKEPPTVALDHAEQSISIDNWRAGVQHDGEKWVVAVGQEYPARSYSDGSGEPGGVDMFEVATCDDLTSAITLTAKVYLGVVVADWLEGMQDERRYRAETAAELETPDATTE